MILYAAILKTINPQKDAEILEEHKTYLQKYVDMGKIYAKGPFIDKSGGLIIFNVPTYEDAKKLMENDPIILNNTREYILKEWKSNID